MNIFDFKKTPEEMDESELRSTLTEFMAKHEENVEEYEAIEAERDEFSETVEALEGDLETAQTFFAEKAAEYTHLDPEVIVERFSLDETIEMAGEAAEAEFSEEEAEEASDDDEETKFSERPEKGRVPSEQSKSQFSEQAKDDVARILGL